MTREEAIRIFESWVECKYEPTRQAAELAVAVFCAQQAPVRIDRNRWEECDYCKLAPYWGKHFCPMCGRPLDEEAWAELERRINDGTADNQTL